MNLPVVLISYNRPAYLRQVCEALRPQCSNRSVYLFQDAVSLGKRYRQAQVQNKIKVEQSISIFKHFFPEGEISAASENLGIAFNTKRAREDTFSRHDAAVFVEDDLVLSPWYMEMMDEFNEQFAGDDALGMVNAYCGTKHGRANTLERQVENKDKLCLMENTLAVLMWSHKYNKIKEVLYKYYDLLANDPYECRPHELIRRFWSTMGFGDLYHPVISSQDCATVYSMLLNDQIKISTHTNNLSYIGVVGHHGSQKIYDRIGWAEFAVYKEKTSGYGLTGEEKQDMLDESKVRHGMTKARGLEKVAE